MQEASQNETAPEGETATPEVAIAVDNRQSEGNPDETLRLPIPLVAADMHDNGEEEAATAKDMTAVVVRVNGGSGAICSAEIELEDVSANANKNTNLTVLRDRYGFFVTDEFRKYIDIPTNTLLRRKRREGSRGMKWIRMIKKWHLYQSVPSRYPKLKKRCRKGIPDAVRGLVWYNLAKGDDIQSKFPDLSLIDISQVPQVTLDEIERDIDRTFPRHVLFTEDGGQGQNALRRILRRYAALDPEVGYCQGMGFLAALFLTYMVEEDAFCTFYSVLQRPTTPLRYMFLPKLVEIQKVLYVFEQLCMQFLGPLWLHLASEGLHPTMFFTEWAMTMFIRGFDFDLVTRVWDIFLLEGDFKIVYRVSLAILKSCEKELMRRKFDKIMAFVREIPHRIDSVAVMDLCWTIPLRRAHIAACEQEHASR